MGLLDDAAKLTGVSATGLAGNSALLQGVLQMLGSGGSGGLTNVVQGFTKAGLGDIVSSWVSTGQNLPISPEQLKQGLGAGPLAQLAQSSGLSEGATASALAGLLPSVVDKLTPGGALPQTGQLQQLVASAKTMLGA
jgi:uncharacterized protein YidB (DUF937 family)